MAAARVCTGEHFTKRLKEKKENEGVLLHWARGLNVAGTPLSYC